jgi:hypothetical protein
MTVAHAVRSRFGNRATDYVAHGNGWVVVIRIGRHSLGREPINSEVGERPLWTAFRTQVGHRASSKSANIGIEDVLHPRECQLLGHEWLLR